MSNVIPIGSYQNYKDLTLIKKITDSGAFFHDDKLTLRAQKVKPANQSPTGKEIVFPLLDDKKWKDSPILQGTENGRYYDSYSDRNISEKEYETLSWREQRELVPCKTWRLNKAALHYMEPGTDRDILDSIRLTIENNQIDLILTGILTERAPESRLKFSVEAIRALHRAGVIKGNWSETTEKKVPYAIIKRHFVVSEYEVAIDGGRMGSALYKKFCQTEAAQRFKKKQGKDFNKAPAYADSTVADTGKQLSMYDRAEHPKNKRVNPDICPFRVELELTRPFFKKYTKADQIEELFTNGIIKGDARAIVNRFREPIEQAFINGVVHMKAPREWDLFINNQRTGKTPSESFDHLIKNRSWTEAVEKLFFDQQKQINELRESKIDRSEFEEHRAEFLQFRDNFLHYHGHELHQQRGLSIV